MTLLRRNVVANLLGRLSSSALRILLLPLYLRLLGVEGWGLVAFYVTLRSFSWLLDFGISAAFIREIARLAAVPGSAQEQRNLFKTLEVIYWSLSLVMGLALMAGAPFIAHRWLRPAHLSYNTVEYAVRLMAAAMCVQFPLAFYQGGLVGLQRQTATNTINVAAGAFQDVGALLILWWISSTVVAFIAWHILSSLVWIAATAIVLRRSLPRAPSPGVFALSSLGTSWRFAAGWTGNAFGGALLTQADKLIVVRFLSLQQFGYYAIAQSVAGFLMTLGSPVQVAAFPRFSQLAAVGDEQMLAEEYKRATQFAALLLFPSAALLITFSREILALWTRRPDVANNGAQLLFFFAIGACLSALATLPGSLQLAYGWFRLILTASFTVGLIALPITALAVTHFGAAGAAVVWMFQNGAVLLTIPFMHRRLVVHQGLAWLRESVLFPAGAAAAVAVVAYYAWPLRVSQPFAVICYIGAVGVTSTVAVALAAPLVRKAIHFRLRRLIV